MKLLLLKVAKEAQKTFMIEARFIIQTIGPLLTYNSDLVQDSEGK